MPKVAETAALSVDVSEEKFGFVTHFHQISCNAGSLFKNSETMLDHKVLNVLNICIKSQIFGQKKHLMLKP